MFFDWFQSVVYSHLVNKIIWVLKFLLLRLVLYAILMNPIYLTLSLCKRWWNQLTRFWWDTNPSNKKLLDRLKKLTNSEKFRGLGLRDNHMSLTLVFNTHKLKNNNQTHWESMETIYEVKKLWWLALRDIHMSLTHWHYSLQHT